MNRSGTPSIPGLLTALALVLAACASSTPSATEAPTTAESAAQTTAQTTAPTTAQSAAATESAAASEGAATGDTVRLSGFAFEPAELTVAAGTEVSFVNADSTTHTVTEGEDGTAVDDPIIDEELAQNASTSVTFDEPGTYQITCRIHPSMQMTITVEG
jgi:plastocyanin